MTDADFEAAITAAFRAFNERRFGDFAGYVTEDVVETYPQSGEQIVGRENQLAFHEAFPNPPTFTIRMIHRDGDLATLNSTRPTPMGASGKTRSSSSCATAWSPP